MTSIVLEQPLDVVELDLGTLRVCQTPAQLFENPAHPLHIDLAGNLHRQIVAEIPPMQGSPERIARAVVALLPAGAGAARAVALTFAIALHRVGQALGARRQGIQRPAL